MLGASVSTKVIGKLQELFKSCATLPDYEFLMPFGHGIFAEIRAEVPDLHLLWRERIEHLLRRPLVEPHSFTDKIEALYPWRKPDFILP